MIKRIITIILVILWIFVIFYFSNSVASISGAQSKAVLSKIVRFVLKTSQSLGLYNNPINNKVISSYVDKYSYAFRKLCHFSVYFICSFFVGAMLNNNLKLRKIWVVTLSSIICFIICVIDEIHQTRVIGRYGRFLDCIIDTCGAIAGVWGYLIFHNLKSRIKKRFGK